MIILQFDFYITARFKPIYVISPSLRYRDFLENYILVFLPINNIKGKERRKETINRVTRKLNLHIIVNRRCIP